MLRIPFILSIVAAVTLLVACPPVEPPPTFCETNPDAEECQDPACLDTPEGCQDPKLLMVHTFPTASIGEKYPIFSQGDEFDGDLTVTLDDPDKVVREAVVFVNLVECVKTAASDCNDVKQVDVRKIFDQNNSSFKPDINKKLYQGASLDDFRSGATTTVDAKLTSSVSPGLYALAVQVFNCNDTNPETVGSTCRDKRIGIKVYLFQVSQ